MCNDPTCLSCQITDQAIKIADQLWKQFGQQPAEAGDSLGSTAYLKALSLSAGAVIGLCRDDLQPAVLLAFSQAVKDVADLARKTKAEKRGIDPSDDVSITMPTGTRLH